MDEWTNLLPMTILRFIYCGIHTHRCQFWMAQTPWRPLGEQLPWTRYSFQPFSFSGQRLLSIDNNTIRYDTMATQEESSHKREAIMKAVMTRNNIVQLQCQTDRERERHIFQCFGWKILFFQNNNTRSIVLSVVLAFFAKDVAPAFAWWRNT